MEGGGQQPHPVPDLSECVRLTDLLGSTQMYCRCVQLSVEEGATLPQSWITSGAEILEWKFQMVQGPLFGTKEGFIAPVVALESFIFSLQAFVKKEPSER